MTKAVFFFIWVVDALIKVTPTMAPPQAPQQTMRIECARNEWESGQLVFRSEKPVKQLSVSVSELKQQDGTGKIDAANVQARFVGMIDVVKNTPNGPEAKLVAKAPAQISDVLWDKKSMAVAANFSQPVWITLHVPPGTPAGEYRGAVELDADGTKQSVPLEARVYGFEIPEQRNVFVTNWLDCERWARQAGIKAYSEEHFKLIDAYAREIAAHRQNVFLTSWRLIKTTREPDGRLTHDFSLFDRYIETFFKAGRFDRIELSFTARFEKDWHSTNIILSTVDATDRATGKRVKLEPEQGLGPLLEHLQQHLEEKGWLEKSMIHVADEASMHNIESYRQASAFVHKHAPKLRRIDAIETVNYQDALEVWVPKISHLYHWQPWFEKAQREGNEMWFYVCNQPRGIMMNRYIDFPLLDTRLLHWLNYRYGVSGYLHWGLDAWRKEPFGALGNDPSEPPGDTHVIYPGKTGPISSIRWEAERDGIEDFEAMLLLEQRLKAAEAKLGPAAAKIDPARRSQELCKRIVRSFTDYSTDPEAFREVRRMMYQEIEEAAAEPLLVWETLPDENTPLVGEPASPVVVHGVTKPGASVKVNGVAVEVGKDGTFLTDTRPKVGNGDKGNKGDKGGKIEVEVTGAGANASESTGTGEQGANKRQAREITVLK